MDFNAAIFDLDGTILDSMDVWAVSYTHLTLPTN